ncbi:hypothetical protein V865_006889 [Kwoniella europaea PYCC6329]|uniref:ASX DEUBAD domain-containing protein n=1 Tax=Kwoniella europaea PYCC6329 TaxID=1423913 RepID=A0AAX4KQR0_9TREE
MPRKASKGEGPKSPLSSCWSFDDLESIDEPPKTDIPSEPNISSSGDDIRFDILIDTMTPSLQVIKFNTLDSNREPSELDKEFMAGVEGSFSRTIEATRPKLIYKYVKAIEKDNSKSSDHSLSESQPSSTTSSKRSSLSSAFPSILHLDPKAPLSILDFDTDEEDIWHSALEFFNERATRGWRRMRCDIAQNKSQMWRDDLNSRSVRSGKGSYDISWDIKFRDVQKG